MIVQDDLESENDLVHALKMSLKERSLLTLIDQIEGQFKGFHVHLCEWSPESFWERISKHRGKEI